MSAENTATGIRDLEGARIAHCGLGARARLRRDRHRGHGPRRGGSASAELARCRPARRNALYGAPRRAPDEAGRARARHGARHHGAARLLAGASAATRSRSSTTRRARTSRATPSDATITRCCADDCSSSPSGSQSEVGDFRLPRIHRHRAGAGSGARRQERHRLARQAHAAVDARGLVFLPRRDLHRSSAAGHRADHGPLRHLHRVHRCVPNRCDRRAVSARRTALHQLPDDRARRADSRSAAAR